MTTFGKYYKKYSRAKAEKDGLLSRLKEAYRYSLPAADVDGSMNSNFNEAPEIYDDTAVLALQKFANKMQTQLTPAWKTWAVLEAGSDVSEDDKEEINKKLEEVTEIIFDHIHHSNFVSASHESHMDLGISTGALICEKGDGISSSLRFRSIPMLELIPAKSHDGTTKTCFREFLMRVHEINELYPTAKLTQTLQQALNDNSDINITLIEGVVYDEKKNQYNHILLYKGEETVLMDITLDSSPYIIYREQVSAGRAMGYGRILQLLPSVIKLNALSYYEDAAVIAAATGSYTIRDDGVMNPDNIRISDPFSLVLVESNDSGNPSIRPLDTSARFDVTDVKIKELQDKINQTMTAQSFGNIEQTPVRSATEMSIRNAEMLQNTQSAMGRLQTEFLETLLARIVYVLGEAGKIPKLRVNGKELTIKFTSPAARIQDAEELAALQEFRMYMESMPPELVAAKFKIEEMPKYVAERTGLPASMIRTKAEEEKAVAGMQQASIQGQQAQTDASVPTQPQG